MTLFSNSENSAFHHPLYIYLLDHLSFMYPIHDPSLSTHDAPSPYPTWVLHTLVRLWLLLQATPMSGLFWVPTPMPGCHPCGHPLFPTLSLTWSHCAPFSAPALQCELPTFCVPLTGLGLDYPGGQGRGRKREGRGRKGKGRALCRF